MAGLNKTGTKTMCAALTFLGYEVFDWMENFWYLGDEWISQIKNGVKVEELRRMYKSVDAITDAPGNFYWEELMEAFPDAKVRLKKVLNVIIKVHFFLVLPSIFVRCCLSMNTCLKLTMTFRKRANNKN